MSHPAEPMPSPTNVGGIFSISREFFERLGFYDNQFEIWGAENLELSFKVTYFKTYMYVHRVCKYDKFLCFKRKD